MRSLIAGLFEYLPPAFTDDSCTSAHTHLAIIFPLALALMTSTEGAKKEKERPDSVESVREEISDGVDVALIRQIARGELSDAVLGAILSEETRSSETGPPPRCTISLLNIVHNLCLGSLIFPHQRKAFWVPRSRLVHRLLEEATSVEDIRQKARLLRRDLPLVRAAAELFLDPSLPEDNGTASSDAASNSQH